MKLSKKILLVDDDRLILEITGKALERAGFECLKALSAEKALSILLTETPDIILSDYDMPEINGFAFRQKVLSDPKLKNIPFVFLTSFTDEDLMMKGLDLRAVDYITKNTSMKVIISKLDNLISTVREEHERSLSELRKAAEALNLRSVPVVAPETEGYITDFFHQSFQNYPGGDFIDFIRVNDQYTFCVLGDVMGKKWGAWFFSFNFMSYIRSAIRLCVFEADFSTASILQKLNKVILPDPVLSDVFANVSLIRMEHRTGSVQYSGAGDLPLLLCRKKGKISKVASSGLLLGLFPDGKYDESSFTLLAGDRLIIISDGMIDYEDTTHKKSDYNRFVNRISPMMKEGRSFEEMKNVLFPENVRSGSIDDCSMIFIEKT